MIRVQVLGRLTLEAHTEPVHALAAQPLRGSVFLYLCVEREATRETLVRLFWPDREEDKARRLLSQTLYELKRLLVDDWFVAVGETIRIENVSVDVHAFETALARGEHDRALALYQGRFLADFQRFDSAEFNAWVDRKSAHYERLHRRARRERIKKLLEEGDRAGALAVAQRWCELDPLEDEAQHRAMELLHELGRRAEALQAYETYVVRLKEVDLVPLDETRALATRVRESTVLPPMPIGSAIAARVLVRAPAAEAPVIAGLPTVEPWHRQRRVRLSAIVGACVVTLAAGVPFVRSAFLDEVRMASLPVDSAGYDLSRVAVLYFDDYTEGAKLDYLAKGLTEALIEELSRVEALSVVSRHGVKPYQNTNVPIDSIARALNVGTIVEGSVQQAGDSIRVNVTLVDARTAARLDSRTLEGRTGAGFALEHLVIREVAAFLRDRLGREMEVRRLARGASNEEAYRLYQLADGFREQVLTANSRQRSSDPRTYEFLLKSADSLLVEAEKRDPQWFEPTLLRGWLAADRGVLTNAPGSKISDAYLKEAVRIASQILRKEPRNAAALELRGIALSRLAANAVRDAAGDSLHNAAEVDLKAAVTIDETRAAAWSRLSHLRQISASFEEAAMYAHRALEADAFLHERHEIINRLYRVEMDRERFSEAADWCRKGHEEYPTSYLFVECYLVLSTVSPTRIPMDSAYRLLAQFRRLDPPRPRATWDYQPIFRQTLLARLWARDNRPDSALAILNRMRSAVAADTLLAGPFGFDAAHVLLLTGDTVGALREIRGFLELNPRYRPYVNEGVAFKGIAHLLH